MLTQLASHYYRPDFTPAQAAQLMADMVCDLEEYPLQQVEVAIRNYRRDPANRFFPRAADLRGLIEADRKARSTNRHGAQRAAEFGDGRPAGWEYQRKQFWKPHWRAQDLDSACQPGRRAAYDKWLAAVKAGKIKGKSPNDY